MLKSLKKNQIFYNIDESLWIDSLLIFSIIAFLTGIQTWLVPGIGHGFTCNLARLWGQHCAAFQDVPWTIRRAQSDVQLPGRHPAARVQVNKSAWPEFLNSTIPFRANCTYIYLLFTNIYIFHCIHSFLLQYFLFFFFKSMFICLSIIYQSIMYEWKAWARYEQLWCSRCGEWWRWVNPVSLKAIFKKAIHPL